EGGTHVRVWYGIKELLSDHHAVVNAEEPARQPADPLSGALARSTIASWALRIANAGALGIDAAVHWQNARRGSWVAALLVCASALAAALLDRYVDVGSLGPLPDAYENTWQVPGKLLSASAETAAVVLAGLRLLTHRRHPGIRRLLPVGTDGQEERMK
ncbi:MAG: hypothetical protein ACRDPL_04370, partial [Propionibacteriaceae bacterium]